MCIRDSCNPIQSNNLKYSFNITIKEPDGKKLVDSMYTESFGAVSYTHLDVYKRQHLP